MFTLNLIAGLMNVGCGNYILGGCLLVSALAIYLHNRDERDEE